MAARNSGVAGGAFSDSWTLWMAPGQAPPDPDLLNDALAAAPAAIRDAGPLQPRRKPEEPQRCRLCGELASLTKEHTPPRAAGNRLNSRAHTVMEWHTRDGFGELPGGKVEQGGIFGYTHCARCNNVTGLPSRGLSTEYAKWARGASSVLADQDHVRALNQRTESAVYRARLTETQPGAFIRQVLSIMFVASGEWGLAVKHPDLAASVLHGTVTEFPDGMWLRMALCPGPSVVMAGPALKVDLSERSWRWMCAFAYPPFAFELTLAASEMDLRSGLCDVGGFVEVHESEVHAVELDLMVAFTHSALPGEWRTEAQIREQLDLDGSDLGD